MRERDYARWVKSTRGRPAWYLVKSAYKVGLGWVNEPTPWTKPNGSGVTK